MSIFIICQIVVCILGFISITAFALNNNKLGLICTVIGEPAWLYSFYICSQYGMFILRYWLFGDGNLRFIQN